MKLGLLRLSFLRPVPCQVFPFLIEDTAFGTRRIRLLLHEVLALNFDLLEMLRSDYVNFRVYLVGCTKLYIYGMILEYILSLCLIECIESTSSG